MPIVHEQIDLGITIHVLSLQRVKLANNRGQSNMILEFSSDVFGSSYSDLDCFAADPLLPLPPMEKTEV
jgi:hypothetical protein